MLPSTGARVDPAQHDAAIAESSRRRARALLWGALACFGIAVGLALLAYHGDAKPPGPEKVRTVWGIVAAPVAFGLFGLARGIAILVSRGRVGSVPGRSRMTPWMYSAAFLIFALLVWWLIPAIVT